MFCYSGMVFFTRLARILAKVGIVLFCLWHMAAIGIYARPSNFSQSTMLEWISSGEPYVRPYILMTSQWQHWNIFALPTSLAMTETHVEKMVNGIWEMIRILDRDHLGFFRRTPETVSMNHLLHDGVDALRDPYLQDVCRTENLETGTHVRIRKRFAFFPEHQGQKSIFWWRAWQPAWSEMIVAETSCNHP